MLFLTGSASMLIGFYNDAHVAVYDYFREDIKQQEIIQPQLDLILPHADSIDIYKHVFFNLMMEVDSLNRNLRLVGFRQSQMMNHVYYYVMVYDPYIDEHGCKYHTRRFPDDGQPETISKRDYWKIIDGTIYLVEATRKGCYYTHYLKGYVELPHKWNTSEGVNH